VIEIVDFGAFKDPEKPTYVMPEADCSLEHYTNQLLPVEQVFAIFNSITAGVEHLHAHSVIHRDLKPDNVLMFGDQPRVSDFGLALIADAPRVTATEEAVGPRFYMAPELEDGRNMEVSQRCDLYSLGKILYFLLSGGQIFSREKFSAPKWNLSKRFADERYRLFDHVFQRTVAPEQDRYASCSELREEFDAVKKEYRKHPRTTLETKAPSLAANLVGMQDELERLSSDEWNVLLGLRRKAAAPYSDVLIVAASTAISKETADEFAHELLRVRSSIERDALSQLASLIVAATDGLLLGQEEEELMLLALDHPDPKAVRATAKTAFGKSPAVLERIAGRISELDEKSLDAFIVASSRQHYPSRAPVLLALLRQGVLASQLGLVVAGLMDEGSDDALEGVAEHLRARESIEELTEAVQGMTLTATSERLKMLAQKKGYSQQVQRTLELLADLHARAMERDQDARVDEEGGGE